VETERRPFTHYLVEGLRTGAVAGRAEWVTDEASFNYVYEQLRRTGAGMTSQCWV
jgi:hypothetical protein